MATKIVLVTGTPLGNSYIQELESLGFEVVNGTAAALARLGIHDDQRDLTEDELAALIKDASVYIYGGLEPASVAGLATADSLDLIAFLGTGWADPGCVDPSAAKQHNIVVSNTPHANAPSVAEMAIGLMICLQRAVVAMNNATKKGGWSPIQRGDIAGRTLGIVGLGHIGSAVARHARLGFGMEVLYTGPNAKPDLETELGVSRVDLGELLVTSDIVSLHVPAGAALGLIDAAALSTLKPNALVLNLSAPEVVVGDALIEVLESGQLRGVAMDGMYPDPLRQRFLGLGDDRFIVLPRAAWLTQDSYTRMAEMAMASIRDVVAGISPVAYQVLPG